MTLKISTCSTHRKNLEWHCQEHEDNLMPMLMVLVDAHDSKCIGPGFGKFLQNMNGEHDFEIVRFGPHPGRCKGNVKK